MRRTSCTKVGIEKQFLNRTVHFASNMWTTNASADSLRMKTDSSRWPQMGLRIYSAIGIGDSQDFCSIKWLTIPKPNTHSEKEQLERER
ncbi:hypothetical protein CEXT_55061 [Caerostris extrusa]|uniref:Uncharacterized protein n=1 Tax=Caerostris extrusa TaxID=172846 RepID=A0AAV4P654_CAEEX|nr:hypothetical protein CEXT_55061 [Caerostris extrusa]